MDTPLTRRTVRRTISLLAGVGASIGLGICTGAAPGVLAADGRYPPPPAPPTALGSLRITPAPHAPSRVWPDAAVSSGTSFAGRGEVDGLTFGATFADAPTASGPWLDGVGASENARQLLAQLAAVDSHGLNAADYDLDGLRDALAALQEDASTRIGLTAAPLARDALDRRFDAAFTALALDLGRGVVDGRTVQSRLFRDRLDPGIGALHEALVRGETDVDSALASVAVAHPEYERLREKTKALLAERASGIARVAIGGSGELLPGQRHRDIMGIKARLIEAGELERRTVLTPMFDAELALAVQRFRRRHGLEPAARIDESTREALARTVEQDLDELALSLERWRWLPRDFGARHVFVNLPGYRLQLVDEGRTIVDMPIVVGARRFPTPSFSRDMSYLEFNPTWTVPASIANRELVPLERRSPGYLESRQFTFLELVDGRLREIPRETVTAADFEETPFPYTLRQRGGPMNALGRMKFMMPNPYAIYLHDTPAKRHFALHERAYSHGCIRLGDPDRLARELMAKDGRSGEEIERALANPLTHRTRLRTHVPTHLVYLTARVDEAGRLQRLPDVYGHDPALREALRRAGLLPSEGRLATPDGTGGSSTVSELAKPVPRTPEPATPG